MEKNLDIVQYPMQKAATAVLASGSSVGVSSFDWASSFMPHSLSDWMACLASLLAALYSLCVLCEWWWKRFWKPLLKQRGWIRHHG